jgi:formylglycine-generating enzyme required for sulfatase activity/nitrate/TMAO reductase-like tetraheme cytochrome c subunit
MVEQTSTDEFCKVCHVHPHVFDSWKKASHFDNPSGVYVHCVECHLPPKGQGYLIQKIRLGAKDIYGFVFKDSSDFNWESKRQLEQAVHFTFESSCLKCHQNLFPVSLTKEGGEAHLYYKNNKENVRCLNCHLDVGHYLPGYKTKDKSILIPEIDTLIYSKPAHVDTLKNYTEYIPGTNISFEMKAVPGGSFLIGSPENEPYREADEGPQTPISVSSFFMAETEVTWDEYMTFYFQTHSEGRSSDTNIKPEVDGITGPTPPYGAPDRGWGFGKRPAISMSYHAAETYCIWLTKKTGKTYRLPTEAEWEYACRAGTGSPFFFEGDPGKLDRERLVNRIIRPDTSVLNNFVIYSLNSGLKTHLPDEVNPNQFGLKNMLGNVAEFCSDWYSPDTYSRISGPAVIDPKGPESGTEHVIRGGSYKSSIAEIRCADRDQIRSDEWLVTDPQSPKSKWWYSDCFFAGFRVICEYDNKTGNNNKKPLINQYLKP